MQPEQHAGNRQFECVFPWTIPDQLNVEGEQGGHGAVRRKTIGRGEKKTADCRPLAYRTWCVEHAKELGGN
ncbi:MAG: hypothetical protein KAV82_12995 [Phycisphaerae bacterium]|nr:hypothetical protein [Phycisphaerae bacterium]